MKREINSEMENEMKCEMENETYLINLYLKQLTPFQMKANEIAKNKLGSTYCIEKSIGFLDFKKSIENIKR
jgi:hypothetical protein